MRMLNQVKIIGFISFIFFMMSETSAESIETMKYRQCEAEGFDALHMARLYLLNGHKRDAILELAGEDQDRLKVANELFEKVGSGEIKNHVDFAIDHFFGCLDKEQIQLKQSRAYARLCYARVDIPFFSLFST